MFFIYNNSSTSDIQSSTSTLVDNIPLISARGDDSRQNQNDQDDDIISEEVRPLPIDCTMDVRMQALHALLQDHTYVQMPKKLMETAAAAASTDSTKHEQQPPPVLPAEIPSNVLAAKTSTVGNHAAFHSEGTLKFGPSQTVSTPVPSIAAPNQTIISSELTASVLTPDSSALLKAKPHTASIPTSANLIGDAETSTSIVKINATTSNTPFPFGISSTG